MILRFLRRLFEPLGTGRSRDYNRRHGKWCVRYKDGAVSEPMCLDVAESYASIFGGKVISRDRLAGAGATEGS